MFHGHRFAIGRSAIFRPLPWWQWALIVAAALSVAIALAIVATGVFLIALPVVAVAFLARRWFGSGRGRDADPGAQGPVIDAEYEVVTVRRARSEKSPWGH